MSIDVNAAFAAERTREIEWAKDAPERARQAAEHERARIDANVASGLWRPLGDGRYQVTSGTDAGEVWTARDTVRDGQVVQVVLPQHGLDSTKGNVALYTRVPTWHELGNVVPEGVSDIDRVMELGGIDFEVVKRSVLFPNGVTLDDGTIDLDVDNPLHKLDDKFVTVRTDTGAGLGVVGSKYEPFQNRQAFAFLEELSGEYGVLWESVGAVRDGRRVFVSMRLPKTVSIDLGHGKFDEILPFIVFLNSHDGSSQIQTVVTPWRPVCGNTERFAVRDALTKWGTSHTSNAQQRVDEARRQLALSIDYYQEFQAEEQALADAELEVAEFHKLVEGLFPRPDRDASEAKHNNWKTRLGTLANVWERNAEELGGNRSAYAAERAITEYLDWGTTTRPTGALRGRHLAARATAVMEGTNDEVKNKAHAKLLKLVSR